MELVGVNRDLTYHFALYLIESDTMRIVRRLQEFETPGDSRTTPPGTRLMIRTAHLTREVVDSLLADPLALGLLYAEVASNVDRGWITPDDSAEDLARFRAEGDKLNYVSTASGLGSFCRQSFGSAVCSYPTEGSACTVMLDEVDLVLVDEAGVDFKFEVSRLRDCRTTGGGEIEEGDNCECARRLLVPSSFFRTLLGLFCSRCDSDVSVLGVSFVQSGSPWRLFYLTLACPFHALSLLRTLPRFVSGSCCRNSFPRTHFLSVVPRSKPHRINPRRTSIQRTHPDPPPCSRAAHPPATPSSHRVYL